jgi:hypothetical protein
MGDVGMTATPFIGGDGISDDEFVKEAGSDGQNVVLQLAAPDARSCPAAAVRRPTRRVQ